MFSWGNVCSDPNHPLLPRDHSGPLLSPLGISRTWIILSLFYTRRQLLAVVLLFTHLFVPIRSGKALIVRFLVCRNWELRLRVLREAVQVFQPVPGTCCSSHSNKWASYNPRTFPCLPVFQLTLETLPFVGTFDIKASRIQECGSVDMSKYGHSQTAKIKSKHCFRLFFLILLFWIVTRLRGVDKTAGTLKMCANIYPSTVISLFPWFFSPSLLL